MALPPVKSERGRNGRGYIWISGSRRSVFCFYVRVPVFVLFGFQQLEETRSWNQTAVAPVGADSSSACWFVHSFGVCLYVYMGHTQKQPPGRWEEVVHIYMLTTFLVTYAEPLGGAARSCITLSLSSCHTSPLFHHSLTSPHALCQHPTFTPVRYCIIHQKTKKKKS